MDLEEKQISENTLYRGKVITVQLCGVELPNGHESVREVVRHSGGAAVLLVSGGKILMERQFRFPYNKVIWEIPAGKLNKGENPEHAARRELEEETASARKSSPASSRSIRRPDIRTKLSMYSLPTAQTMRRSILTTTNL